jgi:hypothetical protein
VWHPRSWPPAVTIVAAGEDPVAKGCPDSGPDAVKTSITENGVPFTLLTSSDAGAGSLYEDRCYYASHGNATYVVDIVIWSHLGCGGGECGAYCGTRYEQECTSLDRDKEIKQPLDLIASTFRFLK